MTDETKNKNETDLREAPSTKLRRREEVVDGPKPKGEGLGVDGPKLKEKGLGVDAPKPEKKDSDGWYTKYAKAQQKAASDAGKKAVEGDDKDTAYAIAMQTYAISAYAGRNVGELAGKAAETISKLKEKLSPAPPTPEPGNKNRLEHK